MFLIPRCHPLLHNPPIEQMDRPVSKLGVPPSDIWMIGDNPDADIVGAKAHGMTTLQKVHQGVEVRTSGPGVPDISFQNYSELRTILSHAGSTASAPE